MTVRLRTFSQAPQAVRSAHGRRWDRMFPAGSRADRTLEIDERNALGLTVQVDRFCDISRAPAIRAIVRCHSSPPQC
jgi:hypothetical protein